MRPIRAIPGSDEPSDRTGGTRVRTGRRSYGNARRHCESSRPPAGLCHAWALAAESLPAVPVPALGHCRRPHRPAPAASHADQGTRREPLPGAGAPPGPAARLPFDSHRWHWPLSPLCPAAWPVHHRLSAAPSRICRDPRGWGPFARPFFCRLLGALEQHLGPLDPLQSFIALGQLLPRPAQGLLFQLDLEPPLDRFVGRKAGGQHPPPDSRHQDLEHGLQTRPVVIGRTSVPTPDHWWENRRKEYPHVLGHLPGKVRELHGNTSWRQ